jgi:hypothetical protein
MLNTLQLRGSAKGCHTDTSTEGDRGIIEKFTTRAVKLHFMSDEVKDAIIGKQENPFQLSYIVDGIVSTARGSLRSTRLRKCMKRWARQSCPRRSVKVGVRRS